MTMKMLLVGVLTLATVAGPIAAPVAARSWGGHGGWHAGWHGGPGRVIVGRGYWGPRYYGPRYYGPGPGAVAAAGLIGLAAGAAIAAPPPYAVPRPTICRTQLLWNDYRGAYDPVQICG